MKDSRSRTATVGLINALTVLSLCSGAAFAQPDSVVLVGKIRDFKSSHPDFGLSTAVGGPVCGLLDFTMPFGGASFAGNGLELTQHCLDGASREIAPHLYSPAPEDTAVFELEGEITMTDKATIDLYDPDGGYDELIARQFPEVDTVDSIEEVTAPTMSVAKVDRMRFGNTDGKFTTLTGEHWADEFWIGNSHTMTISGDVLIRADKSFQVRNISQIILEPGATLTVYIGGKFFVENTSSVGMGSWDHSNVQIFNFGTDPMVFENSADFMGTIVSPNAPVIVENSSDFYGSLTAQAVEMDNTSGIHIAGDYTFSNECFNGGDTQPAAGLASPGQVLSAQSFGTWFRDAPGINLTDSYQLFMDKAGPNYEFTVSGWDPINDELYGNEGGTSNRGFTMDLQGIFLNDNCTDMFIEVESGMDVWLFIDGVMVIDLGGTTGSARQRIELDRVGLASSKWHRVRLLIAQRSNSPQDFKMTTSLPLTPPRDVLVQNSNLYD